MPKSLSYPSKDITNKTFGRLTATSFHGYKLNNKNQKIWLWNCLCVCGKTVLRSKCSLNSERTASCGCFKVERLLKINSGNIGKKRPCKQETKDKIRKSLIGNKPWNTGLKLTKPPHNKLPIKIFYCECCGESFTARITSTQKYAPKHYAKLMSSNKNPAKKQKTKDKIRNTLLQTYKNKPEILENRKPSGINQFSGSFSSIEKPIADALKSMNIGFYHNLRVGKYFPDFIIFDNIIIECDGEYWHKDSEKDRKRDCYLMEKGYYIFRLAGKRILKNPKLCVETIISIMQHLNHQPAINYILN